MIYIKKTDRSCFEMYDSVSQNNKVPACNFYRKQGALLSKVDMYAYYQEEACRNEVQFLWYLDLN